MYFEHGFNTFPYTDNSSYSEHTTRAGLPPTNGEKKCSRRRLSKELNTYKCRNHSKVGTSYAPCSPPSFSSYTVDIAKIKLDTCLDICLDTPAMGAELSLGVEVTPGAVEHSIHVQGCQKCIVSG